MRFKLQLYNPDVGHRILPVNYSYPLSAALYKIIQRGDERYAAFLHDHGYRQAGSLKGFKLFTFSSINTPFKIEGDRMRLLTPEAEIIVCFHLPKAAETFIKGLFLDQEIAIADKKSKVRFRINQVESISTGLSKEPVQELVLQPLSPITSSKPNEKGHYDYLAPEHPDFIPQLLFNWRSKYQTLYDDAEAAFADATMEVLFYKNTTKSRLITIKADTPEETRIKGYVNFQLKVKGRLEALEVLLSAGAGVYNSQGMGCVRIIIDKDSTI